MAGEMIAGTIVGKLLLNTTGWSAAVQAVKGDQKSLADGGVSVTDSFKKMGTAMLAAGTAIIGAMGGIVFKTAEAQHEIYELSQKIGVSVESLSWLKLAGDKAGLTLDGLAVGIGILSKKMVDAASGGQASAKAFNLLGIEVKNTDGTMKSAEEVLMQVADRFKGMEDGAAKTGLAMMMFGRSGKELIPILNGGAEGLLAEKERAKELGMILTTEAAKGATDFIDKTKEMNAALGAASRQIGEALMPVIQGLVEKITSVVIAVRTWIQDHKGLVTSIGEWALKIGVVMLALGGLIKLVFLVAGAIKFLGANMIALATNPMVLLAAAAAGLVVLLYKVAEAEDAAAQAGDRLDAKEKVTRDRLMAAADAAGMTRAAMNGLIEKYGGYVGALEIAITKGKETNELQKALHDTTRKSSAAYADQQKAIEDQKKPVADYNSILQDLMNTTGKASEADKAWIDYLKTEGVTTVDDIKKRIGELNDTLARLDKGYKDGNLSLTDYSRLTAKAKDELALLSGNLDKVAIPKSREFNEIMAGMPATLEDVSAATGDLSEDLRAFGIQSGLSYGDAIKASERWRDEIQMAALRMHTTEKEVVEDIIRIQTQMLILAGIDIPNPFTDLPAEAKTATVETKGYFDNLWSDIAQGFGDVFKKWAEGNLTFTDTLKGLWDTTKKAFFDFVGELVTKWVKSFLEDALISKTASAAAAAGTSMATVGTSLAGIAGTLATVIVSLTAAVASAVVTAATAVASVLVIMATAAAAVLVIMIAAVVAAVVMLAAAAPAILIVAALGMVLIAVVTAIGKLLGQSQKQSDVTYWLKFIRESTLTTADILRLNINAVLHDTVNLLGGWNTAITDGYNRLTDIAHYSTWLPKIYQTLLGIEENTAQGSASGSKVTSPTWQRTGEEAPRIPEYILPEPHLMNLLQTARDAGGGGGSLAVSIEGQRFDMGKGMKKLLIKLVPELSADGFLKINVKALAGER